PQFAASREGNTLANVPFHAPECRFQQVTAASEIAPNGLAVLRGLAFRREGGGTTGSYSIPARSIPRVTIELAPAAVTLDKMASIFANNIRGVVTSVFDAKVDLPYQPVFPNGPGPFNVSFVFSRPYIHRVTDGDLLLDLKSFDPTKTGYSGYWLDAFETRPYGQFWLIGTSGRLSNGGRPLLSLDTSSSQIPGGQLNYSLRSLPQSLPCFWFLGFSRTTWGVLPLPLDLTPLGATGNSLYTGMEIFGPMTVRASGSAFEGYAQLPIPNDPKLDGAGFYTQALVVDPAANTLGVVFSNLFESELGVTRGYAQSYWAAKPDATTATSYRLPSRPGGLVTQWSGSF
ncbi:MAG: hypothetical protein KDC95_17965, partial [Planctomycetes bacterium]|nr:hypothetical protein [Planctomycetota bacterium]